MQKEAHEEDRAVKSHKVYPAEGPQVPARPALNLSQSTWDKVGPSALPAYSVMPETVYKTGCLRCDVFRGKLAPEEAVWGKHLTPLRLPDRPH